MIQIQLNPDVERLALSQLHDPDLAAVHRLRRLPVMARAAAAAMVSIGYQPPRTLRVNLTHGAGVACAILITSDPAVIAQLPEVA